MKKLIAAGLLLSLPVFLTASEFTYQAKVLEATPITTTRTTDAMTDDCFEPAPSSFDKLLEWDLGCDQPRTIEVEAWQVSYQVGNSTLTTTTDIDPGDYLPVHIRLKPLAGNMIARQISRYQ